MLVTVDVLQLEGSSREDFLDSVQPLSFRLELAPGIQVADDA